MTAKSCCDPELCIRREVSSLLNPEAPIIDRIYVAACAVAHTCGELNMDEMQSCAARLFDVAPNCHLVDAFVVAYQTERDACAGRSDIERERAAEYN